MNVLKKKPREEDMYSFAKKIFPYNRSLTGEGVRKTLRDIKKILPKLKIKSAISGLRVFDWTIPPEWKINEAYIIKPDGKKICDYSENNLHIMSYSTNVNKKITLKELNKHLHSLPKKPTAIPYVSSYYEKAWGFAISHNERKNLKKGIYKVVIKSSFFKGKMNYGELFLKGKTKDEIFLSTYICHPSMANNEISGITVLTFLANWIQKKVNTRYSYRIIFVPETIGSIFYINKNLKKLKKNVKAGFVLTCVGDNRAFSYLPSRKGDSLSDDVVKHVLKWKVKKFKSYSWLDRGSDERQFCSPGVDLPICLLMRTKFAAYPEYHTSLDKLGTVVTSKGLNKSLELYKYCLEILENNFKPKTNILCEPFLSKRNLYPTLHTKRLSNYYQIILNLFSLSDGKTSLLKIADICNVPIWELFNISKILKKNKIII